MMQTTLTERNAAIESVRGLIWQVVRRHLRSFGGDPDDAYQECVALLCATWHLYDPTQSAFTTWAQLTCKRHLRQSYALGRLNGPIVRVSLPAFSRGERTHVGSLCAMSDEFGFEPSAREPRQAMSDDEFVAAAERLAGRQLGPDERHLLVSRFVEGRPYNVILQRYPRRKREQVRRVVRRFINEVRRGRTETAKGAS